MSGHYHAIIWIDHREAKVFRIDTLEVGRLVVRPHDPARRIHRNANEVRDGDALIDHEYFERVVEAVIDAKAILITGPASTKPELTTDIARRHPEIAVRIVGVETIDHPCDGALVAVARLHFKAEDRLQLQI